MQAYALTDPGKVRKINQDYIFFSQRPVGALQSLFLLADGMGGQRAGDFASRYVVEHLVEILRGMGDTGTLSLQSEDGRRAVSAQGEDGQRAVPMRGEDGQRPMPIQGTTGDDPSQLLLNGIAQVNRSLYIEAAGRDELEGTGTTLVAACIQGNQLYVANVGDSRLYLIRDNMEQITKDHSFVEEMVAMGKMQRGSWDYQTKKNIITRAVGVAPEVNVDLFVRKLMRGDILCLCSDGLTNMVDEMEIEYIIRSEGDLQGKAAALIGAANRGGGKDNISVALVQYDEPARRDEGRVETC